MAESGTRSKQDFGNRLVAAFSSPRTLEIAAAQVNAGAHIFWPTCDRSIDQSGVAARQFVGVVAALLCAFAHFGIAQIGKIGIVQLQIAATCIGERLDFISIARCDIVVKRRFEFGIGIAAYRAPAATEMQHGRRRDRYFGHVFGCGLQELEICNLYRM